jgi:hypothetical protein
MFAQPVTYPPADQVPAEQATHAAPSQNRPAAQLMAAQVDVPLPV